VLNLQVAEVNAIRAKRTQYLPTVLTQPEARAVIQNIGSVQQLVVKLLYGAGLRLCEVRVQRQHEQDLGRGFGAVPLPYALDRKYPNANRDWVWQFVFPSSQIAKDPRGDLMCRHHLHESGVQKAVKQAVRVTKIPKRAGCHTFRHSCATHLIIKIPSRNYSNYRSGAVQIGGQTAVSPLL
jgi:integrase